MKERYFTSKQVIEALEDAQGYTSQAAEALGCTQQTVNKYCRKFPEIQEARKAIREKRHDFVENQLIKLCKELNPAAIIFYLKCQCKERGYVEKPEEDYSKILAAVGVVAQDAVSHAADRAIQPGQLNQPTPETRV